MDVVAVESDGANGWLIEAEDVNLWTISTDTGPQPIPMYFHVTPEWVEDIRQGLVKINSGDETWLNLLAYQLTLPPDPDRIGSLFVEAYGRAAGNRVARQRLGLKAVTRDGDADLVAVQEGAEVRPWNAARQRPPDTVREFTRRRGEERRNARTSR